MKITIDREAKAAYIYFSSKEKGNVKLSTLPVDENIVIDYTDDGKLFGLEILSLDVLDLDNLKNVEVVDITRRERTAT